jgi:uncharacterized protein
MTKRRFDIPLLIVPGLGGSEPGHWQSHWEELYPSACRVSQLDWDNPDLELWLRQLRLAVDRNPGAVLVGHSLGSVLIAHLARLQPDAPVSGAMLVAPADVDFAETLPISVLGFAPTPMSMLPFPSVVAASTNDPHLSFARANALAQAWGSRIEKIDRAGHINTASGFGFWPAGEKILRDLLDEVRKPERSFWQQPLQMFASRRA